MSFKRLTTGSYADISTVNKKTGGNFNSCSSVNRSDNGQWIKVWPDIVDRTVTGWKVATTGSFVSHGVQIPNSGISQYPRSYGSGFYLVSSQCRQWEGGRLVHHDQFSSYAEATIDCSGAKYLYFDLGPYAINWSGFSGQLSSNLGSLYYDLGSYSEKRWYYTPSSGTITVRITWTIARDQGTGSPSYHIASTCSIEARNFRLTSFLL